MAVLCNRCDRQYRTWDAFYQHVRDSNNHHECPVCDFDGSTWDELLDHCEYQGCRLVCRGCNNGNGSHWYRDSQAYYDHLEDQNVCDQCDRHFSSPSNLYQHELSHRSKMFECYKCERYFKTYGGMIIHLERGTCSDTSEVLLNERAAECRKWRHFIDRDYQDDMYHGRNLHSRYSNPVPYMCPSCDATMSKLSSLFQHIESDSCEQSLDDHIIGQLRNYLASRL